MALNPRGLVGVSGGCITYVVFTGAMVSAGATVNDAALAGIPTPVLFSLLSVRGNAGPAPVEKPLILGPLAATGKVKNSFLNIKFCSPWRAQKVHRRP